MKRIEVKADLAAQESKEMVNHPNHYQLPGCNMEVIDIINLLNEQNGLNAKCGYLYGNVMKYLFRLGKKDDVLQDANKAKRYLTWLVESLEVAQHQSDEASISSDEEQESR